MKAAIGAVGYAYDQTTQLSLANYANSVVLDKRKNTFAFIKDDETGAAHWAERRADRDLFIEQLGDRMNRDMGLVQSAYLDNEKAAPKGVDSAKGLRRDGRPISMLGVSPIDTPPAAPVGPDAEPPTPPMDYADRLVKQDASDYAPSDAGSPSNAMSQMFWRANVERTCRTSLMNNAQELLLLREKCMAKAAAGGNPDACTACVEIAELHVPNVTFGQNINVPVGDSKCSALGVTAKGQVPAGLPAWWFDNYYRWNGRYADNFVWYGAGGLDHPGFDVALTWCTGAEWRGSEYGFGVGVVGSQDLTDAASDDGWLPARDSEISFEPTTTMTYPDALGQSITYSYGISHRRHAQAFIEEFNRTTPNWVFPIVTAVDYTSEIRPVGQCGFERVDSRTKRFEDGVGDAAIYVPQSKVSHWFGGAAGISAPRCGVRQRMYFWNRPCSTAVQGWKFPLPATFNRFDPVAGTEVDQLEYGQDEDPANDYCLLREPRSFVETCPDGMKCSADGECNADEQAAVVTTFTP